MSELPTGTVTFVFTDIEGSTMMLQRLGDAFVEVLEDHNRIIRTAFDAGTEVRSEGDAFFFAFSSAPGALRAAVDAQRELVAFSWPEGGTVRVRIGMRTREGVPGGDDYVGLDVHRAARIALPESGSRSVVRMDTQWSWPHHGVRVTAQSSPWEQQDRDRPWRPHLHSPCRGRVPR